MPSLIVVGKKEGGELPLTVDVTIIGRDRGVTLELADFQVSRRHALVVRTDQGCFVKDLGSRNGILVNDSRVPARREKRLKNGDVLTLGRTSLIFKDVLLAQAVESSQAVVAPKPATAPRPEAPEAKKAVELAVPESGSSAIPSLAPVKAQDARPAPAPAAPAASPQPSSGSVGFVSNAQAAPVRSNTGFASSVQEAIDKAKPPAKPAPDAAAAAPAAPAPGAQPDAAQGRPLGGRPRPRFQELAIDGAPLPLKADDLAVRALLRRAEAERVFFRNLVLGLVVVLLLLVTVLVIYAFHSLNRVGKTSDDQRQATPPPIPVEVVAPQTPPEVKPGIERTTTDPPVPSAPRVGELDQDAFAQNVGPILVRTCATAGCHTSGNKKAGDFTLEPGTMPAEVARNLESVKRFVIPGRPEHSPLLLKALRKDEGGEKHEGGDVLAAESPAYQTIRAWISRAAPPEPVEPEPKRRPLGKEDGAVVGSEPVAAQPKNATPSKPAHKPVGQIARIAGDLATGQQVALDGRGSSDPEGCSLMFRWTLVDRPAGSRAEIGGGDGPQAFIIPDMPGTYCVALVVHDGTQPSEAVRVDLKVTGAPTSGSSRALSADPQGRAYVREVAIDLLGRSARPDETDASLERTRDAFLADVFSRDELYSEWYENELAYLGLVDDFRPAGEAADIPRKLKSHELTPRDAIVLLATSQQFADRYQGADAFSTAVIERLLGLKKDDPGAARLLDPAKKMAEGKPSTIFLKNGKSAGELVRIAVSDRGFVEHLVRRTYRRVTGLDIGADALAKAANRLEQENAQTAGIFDLEKEWVSSQEYLERVPLLRAKSERAFARTLFQDILERLPDEAELRSAREALRALPDAAPLRSALAKILLDNQGARVAQGGSNEEFVRASFRKLLARDPKDKELATYAKALDNGTTRALVVRALVTSSEYEGY